jgi:hypothetical protein
MASSHQTPASANDSSTSAVKTARRRATRAAARSYLPRPVRPGSAPRPVRLAAARRRPLPVGPPPRPHLRDLPPHLPRLWRRYAHPRLHHPSVCDGAGSVWRNAPEWIRTTGLILRRLPLRADLHRHPRNSAVFSVPGVGPASPARGRCVTQFVTGNRVGATSRTRLRAPPMCAAQRAVVLLQGSLVSVLRTRIVMASSPVIPTSSFAS